MVQFTSKQDKTLVMDLEGRGIIFQYAMGQSQIGSLYQVTQSWASIHALLAKLRNRQNYSSWDRSLSVWMQDRELCLKFRTRDMKAEEKCEFSPEETAKIMDFLGRAPNLN